MKILIDADACPGVIKEILFRAADRTKRYLVLVANHPVYIPPSKYIRMHQVESGFDMADNEIVKRLVKGDLVITSDIPLAAEVIKRRFCAESSWGVIYQGKYWCTIKYAEFYGSFTFHWY